MYRVHNIIQYFMYVYNLHFIHTMHSIYILQVCPLFVQTWKQQTIVHNITTGHDNATLL